MMLSSSFQDIFLIIDRVADVLFMLKWEAVNLIKELYTRLDQIRQKSHYQSHRTTSTYNKMSRPVEISQFYGVDVSDYDIKPIRGKQIEKGNEAIVNIENAHLYAFAYQHGLSAPSEKRLVKAVHKNNNGAEVTVNRLNRCFRNFNPNIYARIFKKQKKTVCKVKTTQAKKKQTYQIQSPEQIAIKCARQAYVSALVFDEKKQFKKEPKILSEQEVKRREYQKQRRLERTLIIKAYKYELFNIFGRIIYTRGWKISRQQLKDKLQFPPEDYNIDYMKGILMERYAQADIDRQIFMAKKAKYQQERKERWKKLKAMHRQQRVTFVHQPQNRNPHKQEDYYERQRSRHNKYKKQKAVGERIKRQHKRQMIKQGVWYKGKEHLNNKQIEKQVKDAVIEVQESDEEEHNENETIVTNETTQKDAEVVQ